MSTPTQPFATRPAASRQSGTFSTYQPSRSSFSFGNYENDTNAFSGHFGMNSPRNASFGTASQKQSDVPRDSLDFPASVFSALGVSDRGDRGMGPPQSTAGSAIGAQSATNGAQQQVDDTYTGMRLFERPSASQQHDASRRHTLGGGSVSGGSIFGGGASMQHERPILDTASLAAESLRGGTMATPSLAGGFGGATADTASTNRLSSSALRYNALRSTVAQDLRSPLQRDPHGQHTNARQLDPRWVTIFGFPPEKASYILRQFSHYGEILQYHITGNWMDVEFRTEAVAQKALAKNGKIFDNTLMIGVVECLNPRQSAYAPLEYEQKEKTITSWKFNDTAGEERSRLGASAAAKKRRFESIYREDEEAPKSKQPKKRPRQEESWLQSLVDYVLRF